MAIRLKVNEVLSELFRHRFGFLTRESFDLPGNIFAVVGFALGWGAVFAVGWAVLWIGAMPLTVRHLLSLLAHPLFLLGAVAVVVAVTSWFGSIGIGFSRHHLEQQEKIRKLVNTAETDHLSGLHNRRSFIRALDGEIQRIQRSGRGHGTAGLLFIDIDHFKRINDTYGHAAGDEVICQLSRFLEKACRPYDTVGRWGGEEFVILAPQSTLDQLRRFAERLREGIEQLELKHEYQLIHYTISLGVATYDADSETRDAFVQRADDALYRAKEGGRNCVVTSQWSPEASS